VQSKDTINFLDVESGSVRNHCPSAP
jgi:hypothetical protein